MEDRKIYIRADGNAEIGTGHIMRCLSIAEQLSKIVTDITFITADNSMGDIIRNKGFKNICLESKWSDLDAEIGKLCKIIDSNSPYAILVDSYCVTERYLSELKKYTKTFYMDDINSFSYPVDAIINYNIYGSEIKYALDNNIELYLGTKYAPLRTEFSNQKKRHFEGVRRILITSGGTDEYNVVGNIIETLLKKENVKEYELYCVLGKFNSHKKELERKYNYNKNIHLLANVNNMSEYMSKSDIAITAGGSTCYELCACGVPAIIYTIADNQLEIARSFSQKGIAVWAGDARENMQECMTNIKNEVTRLHNKDIWEQKSGMMQSLVDGKGAMRIAEALTV